MNRHLVTIKISIEGRTDQRMQLNRLSFDQDRFKRLNAQTVQGWGPVQHDRVFTDHLFQNIPHFRAFFFDHPLGRLNGASQSIHFQLGIDKRLEQLQRHFLWETTLMKFQLWANHDHRSA